MINHRGFDGQHSICCNLCAFGGTDQIAERPVGYGEILTTPSQNGQISKKFNFYFSTVLASSNSSNSSNSSIKFFANSIGMRNQVSKYSKGVP